MAHPAGVLKHQRQPRPPGGRAMLSKQTAKLAGVPIAAHIPCRHAGIQQQRLLPVSAVSGLRLHAAATSGSSNCLPPMPSLQLQYHCRQHQQQPWRGAACCPPAAIAPPLEGLAALTAGPQWDYVCAALTAIVALAWVKLFDVLAGSGVLDQKLSRKLVHATAGPIFLLTWPYFSALPQARFIAAVIPTLNLIRLLAVGSGALSDPGLVKSVSRQGDRSELLKGPLYYCAVLLAVTLLFWRTNPTGTIAVAMMAGGDGFADIVGRRLGASPALKLPWNAAKSWPGSLAMFGAGLAMSAGFFWLFCGAGFFECYSPSVVLPYLAIVCCSCTLVESLPINSWFDDNLSVPLVAIATSLAVLPAAAAASAACKVGGPAALMSSAQHWLC